MLTPSSPRASFDGWRLLRVIAILGLGTLALAQTAATVGVAVLECSGRFPEKDVCPGRPHGWPLVALAAAAAVVPFGAGLVIATGSTSDRSAVVVMAAAGIVMVSAAVGVEAWATGTIL